MAFVIAGGSVRIKVPYPTVAKAIACLLGAYYAWDTSYPIAYSRIMTYIDHEVLGTKLDSKKGINKFIRDLDNKIKVVKNAGKT